MTQEEIIADAKAKLTQINANFNYLNTNKVNTSDLGNGTLTIKRNGTSLGTHSANTKTNTEVDIAVPVQMSDLSDGANYYTKTQTDAKINSKIASAYKPGGTKTLATLPTLSADNLGFVYNMSEDFITTADFVEGAGKPYTVGADVGIVNVGTDENPSYKYNVLSGFIDTSTYDTHIADTAIHVTAVKKAEWDAKQSALTFDNAPTENSNNPVKSGGIYTALQGKADASTTYSKTEVDTLIAACFDVTITPLGV